MKQLFPFRWLLVAGSFLLACPSQAQVTLPSAIAVDREISHYLQVQRLAYTCIIGHQVHATIAPATFAATLQLN
jgi:hypothetical protein